MTSASTHESQAAIPLGTLTAERVENLHDLMDAAYDSDPRASPLQAFGHHFRYPIRIVIVGFAGHVPTALVTLYLDDALSIYGKLNRRLGLDREA